MAQTDRLEPLAVVGFSMRFPEEATSPDGLWEILYTGRNVMTEVPLDRFNINGFYHPDPSRPDTINARGGHFLKGDIAAFDAPFFSMNPSEVESMDPQQRILLETSYHAFENAGIPIQNVAGSRSAVYVGSVGVDYNTLFDVDEEIQPIYKATGNADALLANRISWFYDLRGPSMTIETACSSSMVALHLACQSLRAGESKIGLVAGSQLYLDPLTSAISLSSLKFMSSDSRCLSFDDRGNGYAKGEGVGVLILKPLKDALDDGDTIRAVIRSTITNQDGRTPGITQPSLAAQEKQIREAYKIGGLDLCSTRLFEAHGTGTALGDPIEAEAIRRVFQEYRSREHPMYVGAVKSNIGHLEAVAGIAGVIKVILCLERGIIPPNSGFEVLNRRLKDNEWNLRFPTEPVPWPCDSLRRASVNSFGYGGSNAHVILDDAYNYLRKRNLQGNHCTVTEPPTDVNSCKSLPHSDGAVCASTPVNMSSNGLPNEHPSYTVNGNAGSSLRLFVWSASDAAGIERLGHAYRHYLSQRRPISDTRGFLRNLAFSLSDKRSLLPWKSYILAGSCDELIEKLECIPKPSRSSVPPKVNFIFTGQGAQWATMGLGLLSYPQTKTCLIQAEQYFKSLGSDWSLVEELKRTDESSRLSDPILAQPVCTALQVALVELLASWGVRPQGVVGHSSGEIAAAFCVGAIDREAAWTIAYFRGALAATLAAASAGSKDRGAMMSVQLSEAEIHPYLEEARNAQQGDVAIGCENSPSNLTLTGLETAIDFLKERFDSDGIFTRKLAIPVAYHSSHMEVIADEYLDRLQSIHQSQNSSQGKVKHSPFFVSSVTGSTISPSQLSQPEYWVRNLVSRVRFAEAVIGLHSASPDVSLSNQVNYCIEIGPHPAMQKPVKDTLSDIEGTKYDTTLRRGVDSTETLMNLAGRLFSAGYPIDVQAVNTYRSTNEPARMLPDLPKYPFNHSQRYWLESRLVKNQRQRVKPRHELLGLPVTDWNPLKPRWRYTIRNRDLPWLKDHQLNGTLLYPGAGMLTMVIEAARSIANPDLVVKGYRFRDVTIHNALVVPSDAHGVEVQLYIQNQKNSRTTGIATIECREFCLSSCADNEWKDVCSGLITTEYTDKSSGIYEVEEDVQMSGDFMRYRLQEIIDSCSAKASEEHVYQISKQIGFEFGPTFRTLSDISYDPAGRYSVATLTLDEWMTKLPAKPTVEPHVIHPTALDGVLQTMSLMINKGGTELGPLHAPTQFQEIWISNALLSRDSDAKIRVGAKATRFAVRDLDASITALSLDTREPVLTIEGYRVTMLSKQNYEPSEMRNLFYSQEWRPDVELLGQLETERYCIEEVGTRLEWDPAQKIVCLYYMTKALEELDEEGFKSPKHHLQKYQSWMRYHLEGLGNDNPLLHSPWKESFAPESKDEFMAEFITKGRVERALHIFCSQLSQIIRDQADPLDLLFNQGLASDIYSDDVFIITGKRAAAFVKLVAHKNPNMDILEIGAGTGMATDPILASLLPHGDHQATPKYNSYTFTDISPSFFEKAADRFVRHADRMAFKILDIEQDPLGQGFERRKYDMVVAAAVLHATADIRETLRNIYSLLKPDGYLIIVEPTNKWSTVSDSVWGTLPGWWRGTEDDRQQGPLYSRPEWDACLKEIGFTGVEIYIPDHGEEDHHTLSLMVSRPAPKSEFTAQASTHRTMTILANTELQHEVASEVASYMKDSEHISSCSIVSPSSLLSRRDKIDVLVTLVELEDPFFSSMTEDNLAIVKAMVDSSRQVYWLTSGGGAKAPQPEKAMSSGFGRAVAQEYPGLWFANIDVDDPKTAAETWAKVFRRNVGIIDHDDWESDYQQSNKIISIPRVIEAGDINAFVHSQTGQLAVETKVVGKEPTERLELQYSVGQLDGFRFACDRSADKALPDDEVEVEIKATGVNFIDVMVILGQLAGTHLGCEYSGVVRRTGSAVTTLAPGDRVCFLGADGFRTYVRCKAFIAARIPDSLPFTDVFPAVYLTTIYSLNHVARLCKGESILVHAAAGGVGQAAVQLAQHIGADVFVTVSSTEKRRLMQEHYNIPDDRIFYSRNLSFGRQIMQVTRGRGVDVVLNSLSGEAVSESLRILAPLGRFVEIGKRDIHTFQNLPLQPFVRNVSYHAVNTKSVELYSPAVMRQVVLELEDMLAAGTFQAPRPVSVFTRGQFESAIRYLQSGRHMGKAVVDWEAEAEIPVVPSPEPAANFNTNASYVIAGGLGGIGRSLAAWFGRRGGKYLILLSRSGPTSEAAKNLIKELTAGGVTVATPRCDVSNTQSLKEAINGATKTMPPIKGCIQASMVLKDRVLQNMTLDEWQAVLDPKVSGTWNLHRNLPEKMDFFVILSSTGGMIGSTGQSQYNAASTFQDAFARHRWSLGEQCVSIDVGVVQGIGYVAEHSNIAKRWNETKIQVLDEKDLIAVVDWACSRPARDHLSGAATALSPWSTQVITGAGPAAKVDREAMDSMPYLKRPLFRALRQINAHGAGAGTQARTQDEKTDYGALLRAAGNLNEAGAIIAAALAKRLARALSVPEEDIDTTRPAHSYGVDSLVAVELRFWFSNEIRSDISVFSILANDPILALGRFAAQKKHQTPFQSSPMASYFVTGASRGLGLALVRELISHPISKVGTVFAAARSDSPVLNELAQKSSGRVIVIKLDVTDNDSIKKAAAGVDSKLGGKGLDVLINNAGICLYAFGESFTINVMGVHWMTQEFLPLLQKGTQKKVINMTTTLGSTTMARANTFLPAPAYKISKAAANALTVQYSIEYEKQGFSFIALSPGWLKTELGGGDMADLTTEEGAKASLDIIFEEGQKYNGQMTKVFVKGWEDSENPKGRHIYDGTSAPWRRNKSVTYNGD
ncbi:hypothetical protein F5B20DRAFT_586970 [Whalleya microplaca]|nr:hypothetical protein F5B20DRAFT_586970 [Whalleya microplaca]